MHHVFLSAGLAFGSLADMVYEYAPVGVWALTVAMRAARASNTAEKNIVDRKMLKLDGRRSALLDCFGTIDARRKIYLWMKCDCRATSQWA